MKMDFKQYCVRQVGTSIRIAYGPSSFLFRTHRKGSQGVLAVGDCMSFYLLSWRKRRGRGPSRQAGRQAGDDGTGSSTDPEKPS